MDEVLSAGTNPLLSAFRGERKNATCSHVYCLHCILYLYITIYIYKYGGILSSQPGYLVHLSPVSSFFYPRPQKNCTNCKWNGDFFSRHWKCNGACTCPFFYAASERGLKRGALKNEREEQCPFYLSLCFPLPLPCFHPSRL